MRAIEAKVVVLGTQGNREFLYLAFFGIILPVGQIESKYIITIIMIVIIWINALSIDKT